MSVCAYLILVHNRTTGGGVLFSSRCTFFHKKRNKDCFQHSLLRENCTSLVMKACQLHQTKHQVHQTKSMYAKQNTRYAKKHQIRQKIPQIRQKTPTMPNKTPNTQKNTKYAKKKNTPKIFLYAVLSGKNFCSKFTHFVGVLFTDLKSMVVYQNGQISGMALI